ncbi:MAG TPA: chemotaxis protein CheW [Longimicrobiales bacterium]|nr:chemotaxis protein CheW [Longimicrobiales bacterium]
MTILVFRLGPERYAIRLADVRRILAAAAVTRLPGAPTVVEGVGGLVLIHNLSEFLTEAESVELDAALSGAVEVETGPDEA